MLSGTSPIEGRARRLGRLGQGDVEGRVSHQLHIRDAQAPPGVFGSGTPTMPAVAPRPARTLHPSTTHLPQAPGTALVEDLSLDELEHKGAAGHRGHGLRTRAAPTTSTLCVSKDRRSLEPLAAPTPPSWPASPTSPPPPRCSGAPSARPVAIAPTAIQGLAHPEGEVATGAAPRDGTGTLLILSSLATCRRGGGRPHHARRHPLDVRSTSSAKRARTRNCCI